jgi:hypothetical protein
MKKLLLILLLPMLAQAAPVKRDANGRIYRSRTVVARFQHSTVCPATGRTGTPCPGFLVDHRKPLGCAKTEAERARLDSVVNMQYQTIADARAKDKIERKQCGV